MKPSSPTLRSSEFAVGARLVDRALERRACQQPLAIGDHVAECRVDAVRPVGIEQERRGAAVGEAEVVAGRPFAPGHVPVEPGVRGVEHRARIGDAARVAVGLGAQAVEDDFLLRRGNVVVEVPVHAAYLERGARSEEHTSELQSLMRNSYAVFCLKKKKKKKIQAHTIHKTRDKTHYTLKVKLTVLIYLRVIEKKHE